jgi:hypothetical protein
MWRRVLVMVFPCMLTSACLGANLQNLTDFKLTLPHSYRINDTHLPDDNYSERATTSRLVSLSSHGILLYIMGRERTCHCSPRIQNRHRIQGRSGILYLWRSAQRPRKKKRSLLRSHIDIGRIGHHNICRTTLAGRNVQVCQ